MVRRSASTDSGGYRAEADGGFGLDDGRGPTWWVLKWEGRADPEHAGIDADAGKYWGPIDRDSLPRATILLQRDLEKRVSFVLRVYVETRVL